MNAPIPAHATLSWRQLGPGDLEAMQTLHLLSVHGQGADVVKPETRDFLASLLAGRGQVVAAFDGPRLIAYGVLQHDLLAEDGLPHELRTTLPVETPLLKLAGAAVAPAWRGLGLQRRLIAERLALAPATAWLFSTAAPANVPSWNNLLAQRFEVRAIVHRYGGFARYLMLRRPGTPARPACGGSGGVQVPAADLARQQQLLAQGFAGCLPGDASDRLVYLHAPGG